MIKAWSGEADIITWVQIPDRVHVQSLSEPLLSLVKSDYISGGLPGPHEVVH